MANLTPATFSIDTTQTQELTSAYADRIWTILSGAGSLGAGSTAYKRIFTPSSAGAVTIAARAKPGWTSYNLSTLNSDTQELVTSSQDGNFFYAADGSLTNVGDSAVWQIQATAGGFKYVYLYDGGMIKNVVLLNYSQIQLKNTSESVQYGTTVNYSAGDKLGVEMIDAGSGLKKIRITKNPGTSGAVIVGTTDETYSSSVTIALYFTNNLPVGTVTEPILFGNVPTETATGVVTAYADTTPPSDVANLTADASRNLNSDAASDNIGVAGYVTQRRINGGAWGALTPTTRTFQDTENLPTAVGSYTLEYRRKAVDAAGNQSQNWSNVAETQYTVAAPPSAPEFVTTSPLKYAQTGKPYSLQMQVAGGSGYGTYQYISGNLPVGGFNGSGLVSISAVGSTDYTFTVRYTDSVTGLFAEKTFTIPVSEYAWIQLCYHRPLKKKLILTTSEFQAIDGLPDVAEDAPAKYEYDLTLIAQGQQEVRDLERFFFDYRLKQPFWWFNPDWNETTLVYAATEFSAERMLAYGGVQVILREV